MQRLGIFGGTFDPIHFAHLAVAEEASSQLGLPEVRFIPAWQPPHKGGVHVTPAAHRLEMTRLAIADNPAFSLSTQEIERGGPSYTVDTLAAIRAREHHDCELFFIAGSDSLASFLTWREPARVLELATLAVIQRPGAMPYDLAALHTQLPAVRHRVLLLQGPRFELSSTILRQRVRAGLTIRYQLPEAVRQYIDYHHLYQGGEPA